MNYPLTKSSTPASELEEFLLPYNYSLGVAEIPQEI